MNKKMKIISLLVSITLFITAINVPIVADEINDGIQEIILEENEENSVNDEDVIEPINEEVIESIEQANEEPIDNIEEVNEDSLSNDEITDSMLTVEDIKENIENNSNMDVIDVNEIDNDNDNLQIFDIELDIPNGVVNDDYAAPRVTSHRAFGTLPESYDSRDINIVTSVKDQGNYGICWAEAMASCIESNIIKKGLKVNGQQSTIDNLDISELKLAYAGYQIFDDDKLRNLCETGNRFFDSGKLLNQGGSPYIEKSIIQKDDGIVLESDMPYSDAEKYNKNTPRNGYKLSNPYQLHVQNFLEVNKNDTNVIKKYIMEYGSGIIMYCGSHQRVAYEYDENNEQIGKHAVVWHNSSEAYDHAVTIVGWDDNYPKEYFAKGPTIMPQNNGAWLIKNSWGDQPELEDGYFWLSYEDKTIGSTLIFYDINNNVYENVYQMNGVTGTTYGLDGQNTLYVANKYTNCTGKTQYIKATSIDVNNTNVSAEVYISKFDEFMKYQLNDTNNYYCYSINEKKCAKTSDYFETAGLHMTQLDGIVKIEPNEMFLVCYKLSAQNEIRVGTAPGWNNIDEFDNFTGYYTTVENASIWYTTKGNQYCNNLAIRAYTVSETNKELKSINASLKENVSFIEGDTITTDKINVTATTESTLYDNEKIENEPITLNSSDFTIIGETTLNGGDNNITISYTSNNVTKTYVLNVYATPHTHSYTSQITKEPTCEGKGEKKYTCSGCGDTYTEYITANGHSYKSKVTKIATCKDEGEKTYICSSCGDTYTEPIEKTQSHLYKSKVTKIATCKDKGEKTYTCEICEKTYTEPIEKTQNHSYKSKVTKEATCKDEGEKTYTCEICEKTYTEPIAKTQNHSYKSQITKEATCEDEGETTYTCEICEKTYTEPIEAKGHSYTSQITKEATCEGEGETTYTCSGCGDTYTEPIEAKEHSYTSEVTKEATCKDEGETTYTCSGCGDTYTEPVETKNHNYTSQITKEPTRKDEGETTYTCSGCGDTYTEPIEKLDEITNQVLDIVVVDNTTTMNILLAKGNKLSRPEMAKTKADGKIYKVRTSNKKVATINTKGNIVAKGSGTCIIEVQKANMKYICYIEVTTPSFAQKKYIINKGETINLDFSGTDLKVYYSISTMQLKYASHDGHGNVTGLSKGSATVVARVFGTKYTTKVTVLDPQIKELKTNVVKKGKTLTLKVINGDKKTTWESSDTSIATVDTKGKVKGVSPGTVTIKAKNHGVEMEQEIIVQ